VDHLYSSNTVRNARGIKRLTAKPMVHRPSVKNNEEDIKIFRRMKIIISPLLKRMHGLHCLLRSTETYNINRYICRCLVYYFSASSGKPSTAAAQAARATGLRFTPLADPSGFGSTWGQKVAQRQDDVLIKHVMICN
jgi:hypothetical protein